MALMVNDNDGDGRTRWLEWHQGPSVAERTRRAPVKVPDYYCTLKLLDQKQPYISVAEREAEAPAVPETSVKLERASGRVNELLATLRQRLESLRRRVKRNRSADRPLVAQALSLNIAERFLRRWIPSDRKGKTELPHRLLFFFTDDAPRTGQTGRGQKYETLEIRPRSAGRWRRQQGWASSIRARLAGNA